MKPRLFIGSSRESLTLAYAAQQNLHETAEVTVWDQGVFQLSVTAIESLLPALITFDYGLFVFAPDDITNIRGEENRSVRDNVIFELGLFVGTLGRDRCFILVPDSAGDLHIPTDLIGMAPALFETDRSDGSLQAATASACHDIRAVMEAKGPRPGRSQAPRLSPDVPAPGEPDQESEIESSIATRESVAHQLPDRGWLDAILNDDWAKAAELLAQRLEVTDDEDEQPRLDGWLGRAKYNLRPSDGVQYLESLMEKYPGSDFAYIHLARAYIGNDLWQEALRTVDLGLGAVSDASVLVQIKVECLSVLGRGAEVAGILRQAITEMPEEPGLYISLAEYYSEAGDDDQARKVLDEAKRRIPGNEVILDRYARHLAKTNEDKSALVLYEELIQLRPEETRYLVLRANAFLALELHDLAMRDYKKADELVGGRQEWIASNIGNLLKNRGFYHEGIEYLNRAIELDQGSQYAHERLAIAIKLRDEEQKQYLDFLKEAHKEMAAFTVKDDEEAESQTGT